MGLSEIARPWGAYARVPAVEIIGNTAAVVVQFSIYLALLGWVDSRAEQSTAFLRGLPTLCVPCWSAGIYATLCEFLDGKKASYRGMLLSALLFTACCTALAALPGELGLVVQVLGGALLHAVLLLAGSLSRLRRGGSGGGGRLPKHYLAAQCYFVASCLCVLFAAVSGWCLLLWWPFVADEHPVLAGPALVLASNAGEAVSVAAVQALDERFYKRVPNSRRMGSWAVVLVRAVSDTLKLSTLWYSAVRRPSMASMGWLSALVSSVCINTAVRLGWLDQLAWRLTRRRAFWVPGCWTLLRWDTKFALGLGPLAGPLAVVGARCMLSLALETTESVHFNEKVVCVLAGSLVAELLEHEAVSFADSKGLSPKWYRDSSVRELTSRMNAKDPDCASAAVAIDGDQVVQKVRSLQTPFDSRLVSLAIFSAATFLSYSGLVFLASLDYLLGVSSEVQGPAAAVRNGGLLWAP